ncbi:MAG TPA: hypothetical protein VJT13_00190 [Xanthobacteraceae bacterium]|nr:hypothetical protein [Xanthobacteraceae bacterium]
MAAPKTKDWSARENAHKPKGMHLLVHGQVEVDALNKAPRLTKIGSKDPAVCALELTIVDTDEQGGDAVVWKGANFHEEVKDDQYKTVSIRWDGPEIASIAVIDDREHGAALKKQSDAHNAAAARTIKLKPAKPAPKKAAAKTAAKTAAPKKAAKKKAPKAVGGWAKNAKKKTAKKSAKKTAKKAAKKTSKKSMFGKLVKKVVKKLTPAKKKKRR